MNYVSAELSAIQMLDPKRHELALLQDEFLSKGGTIQELVPFAYVPPPIRHEPPPRKKAAKPKPAPQAAAPAWLDKMAQRDIEREERVAQRAKEKAEQTEYIRKLAETMCYAQAVLRTGLPMRTLQRIAKQNNFKFQPAPNAGHRNLRPKIIDEAAESVLAEQIEACKERGLTRNQAMEEVRISHTVFVRILDKFAIDYPKRSKGPHPAFFAKE